MLSGYQLFEKKLCSFVTISLELKNKEMANGKVTLQLCLERTVYKIIVSIKGLISASFCLLSVHVLVFVFN